MRTGEQSKIEGKVTLEAIQYIGGEKKDE